MITKLKDTEMRASAVIFQSNLEQIRGIYTSNPELAAELAIATIEMALTGEISSDDLMVKAMLTHYKYSTTSNATKYEKRKENTRQAYITKSRLDEIAELYNQGYKQIEISKKLDIPKSTIYDRIKKIREEYPELLLKNPDDKESDLDQGAGLKQEDKNSEQGGLSDDSGKITELPDSDPDEKSGNEADFIEKTGFIF